MSLLSSRACAGVCCVVALLAANAPALAHAIVGSRVFPATLAIDDPGVSDELALPTFTYLPTDSSSAEEYDLSFNYSKRIFDKLALSIGDGWTHLRPGGAGWRDLDTQLKYEFFTNAAHEFMASVSLDAEWGNTGATRVGAAPFTTITPNLYVGKGFGDLPASLNVLRPFAVTGQFGLALPTESVTFGQQNPTLFNWGFTLQYSLPYLNSNVREVDGPRFLKHLIPLVEVALQTPVSNIPLGGAATTGTIQPGIMYMGNDYQVSLEAVLPVNGASGHGVGVMGELHFFLDDMFPNSIGKPLFQ